MKFRWLLVSPSFGSGNYEILASSKTSHHSPHLALQHFKQKDVYINTANGAQIALSVETEPELHHSVNSYKHPIWRFRWGKIVDSPAANDRFLNVVHESESQCLSVNQCLSELFASDFDSNLQKSLPPGPKTDIVFIDNFFNEI